MHMADLSSQNIEDQPSLGEIRINHTVVASIVRLAAMQIPGVCGVGGGFVDGIAELFSKKETDRGVKVDEDESGNYAIEIRLVIAFGTEIGRTAYEVQMAVRKQVLNMTGKTVARIDVIVEGVKFQEANKPSASESAAPWPEAHAVD